MKITFLGTRGFVDEYSRLHKNRSSILIESNKVRLLIDFGDLYEPEMLNRIKPTHLLITHYHPDHAFGLKKVSELNIPIYITQESLNSDYYKEEDIEHLKKNFKIYKMKDSFKIGTIRVESVPILHSTKAPNVALFISDEISKICYASDVASIDKEDRNRLLTNCSLYIGDLSTHRKKGLIRKDKKTGDIIGHADIRTQLAWCRDANVKTVAFTHLGTEPIEMHERELEKLITELGSKYNIGKVIIAKDGLIMDTATLEVTPKEVEPITPKVIARPQYGLYLKPPHGELIWLEEKDMIVKVRKFTEHINEDLYLISGKLCYGIIRIKEPYEISEEEFWRLKDRHEITEEEFEEWGWKGKTLYAYEVILVQKFDPPIPCTVPKGIQVFVKKENIKFKTRRELSDIELEYYHILTHNKFREIGDSWCKLHSYIVDEYLTRGLTHLYVALCDRVLELIRTPFEKYIKNIRKVADRPLGDDWRIVLAWYTSLRQGKKLYRKLNDKKVPITIKDTKELALAICKEMIRRGFTFNKPETYKPYARELFEWVIKQIGEEKIPWKKELEFSHPYRVTIADIDPIYVTKLNNQELRKLHNYLHEVFKERGRKWEDLENAHIFVGIELLKRGLEFHFTSKDELDEQTRLEIVEYPLPAKAESKVITIDTILENLPPLVVVEGQPYAGYVTGRRVNLGYADTTHDQDLVLRQGFDPRVIRAFKKINPKWLAKLLHIVFDIHGPLIGFSIPVYRYGFIKIPREEMVKGFGPYRLELEQKLKPFFRFTSLKAKAGWEKYEFWKVENLWDTWASKYIERGIIVQKKYDGRRFQVHKQGDRIAIITEDRKRDRANVMENIVKDLLKEVKAESYILDTEFVEYDCKGKVPKDAKTKEFVCEEIPREDTASLTVGDLPPEEEERVLIHAHDLLYLNGKVLANLGYEERLRQLRKLIPEGLKRIRVVETSEPVYNLKAFLKVVKKYRTIKGSEGVMLKVADSPYPITTKEQNRTALWAKLKNLKALEVIVLDIIPKREVKTGKIIPGVWMYVTGIRIPKEEMKIWRTQDLIELDGRIYAKIGKTFSTSIKCKKGDIIEVLVGRIREYVDKKTGKHYITWMFPKVREKRPEKKEPDTLDTARKLAKVGPEHIVLSDDIIRVELEPCPFYKERNVCPLVIRFRPALETTIMIQKRRFPLACPLSTVFKCVYVKDYYYDWRVYKRKAL